MLTSSPIASPILPNSTCRRQFSAVTPQTSRTLSKSHRLLRPLKSKLHSIQQYHDSNPSLSRLETIWSPNVWPPPARVRTKSYEGRRKRTRSNNNAQDDSSRRVWEEAQISDVDALTFGRHAIASVSIGNMFVSLHSSYRTFLSQFDTRCECSSLTDLATYTLGTWTYLYEQQSSRNPTDSTPSNEEEIELTLDDVLLEYLPPTRQHLPLLLGYTVSLFNDYMRFIRPLLPSLIILTSSVSRRATCDLAHILFAHAGATWEDFSLCMTVSRLIGREDEYIRWLSQNMSDAYIEYGGLGHLLRLGRDYPSFGAVVCRAVRLCVPVKRAPVDEHLELLIGTLVQHVCTSAQQSGSTKYLFQLVSALPSRTTALPSLSLLVHLTLKTLIPEYLDTNLLPFVNRDLTFSSIRDVFTSITLKTLITYLIESSTLHALGISLVRDWKEHINHDGDPDDLESVQEFLQRVEREYLTEKEGVKWRYEPALHEWIGEWPDGREVWSSKLTRVRRIDLQKEGDNLDEEEFSGSLVKRSVPRSGLIMETPAPRRNVDGPSRRKGLLERFSRLSSITKTTMVRNTDVESDPGSSQKWVAVKQPKFDKGMMNQLTEDTDKELNKEKFYQSKSSRKRTRVSHNELNIYRNSDLEFPVAAKLRPKDKKRRKSDDSDEDSNGSIYVNSDLENQPVKSNSDAEPLTSDVDELSILMRPPRHALYGIAVNRRGARSSSFTSFNKMLVRESSPIFVGDTSDDELTI